MDTRAGTGQVAARHRGRAGTVWLRAWLWCEAAWRDFLNLVLPADCVVCGADDHALCPGCAVLLRQQTGAPFRAEQHADALMGVSGDPLLTVFAAGEYRDALAQAILAFKNHGRTELGPPLARVLARTLTAALTGPGPPDQHMCPAQDINPARLIPHGLLLVPVPSTGSGWRRRGYDPVALLLRALIREGRLPEGLEVAPVLRIKTKLPWHRAHQKGLGRAARRRNVRNTMAIKAKKVRNFRPTAKPSGQEIVLLDDVLTTGSTLREAAKTLELAGFNLRCAVVLAAAKAPSGDAETSGRSGGAENNF
ncbi:putative amidophosphoribosyltransferase [Arthrobacter sp. UYCu511]|uniref:ComF family protein n=1 Tax=Arthrobacter sp. UYCu511 TaxID=3156337 RepID=UPI003396B26D